jgi:ribosomal protein S3AE
MNESNLWFSISASELENAHVGDVLGTAENVVGRKIAVSALQITTVRAKPGYKIIFSINEASNSEGKASIHSIRMSREQINRMVRHNISKMDIVVPVKVEGRSYAVKVVCVINKAKNRYKKAIRNEVKELLTKEAKDISVKDMFINALTNKTQNSMHKAVTKIYPTRAIEVRAIVPKIK